jgi:hypothetical protein
LWRHNAPTWVGDVSSPGLAGVTSGEPNPGARLALSQRSTPAWKALDVAVSGAQTHTTPPSNLDLYDNVSYQVVWTGTPVGTIQVDVSNDYNPQLNTGTWTDITAQLTPPPVNPSGSAGNHAIDLHQLPFAYVRLRYVHASGSGQVTVTYKAKAL